MTDSIVEMYQKNIPVYLIAKSMNMTEYQVVSEIVDFSFTLDIINIDKNKLHKEYLKIGLEKSVERFQISYPSLIYFLVRNDENFFTKGINGAFLWSNEVLPKLYLEEFLPISTIAGIFNCSERAVKSELSRQGISIKRESEYDLNHDYFSKVNSDEKAYWLGFMLTCNSIDSLNNNIFVKLNDIDVKHLEKFAKSLNFTGEIEIGSHVTVNNLNNKYCFLKFSSSKMKKDLMTLGCASNKKYNMGVIPKISSEFHFDFIRGIVDGNGLIVNNKPKSHILEISGSKILMEWVKEIIQDKFKDGVMRITPEVGYFKLVIAEGTEKIIEKIYENSEIYLERNFQKVKENIL